MAGKVNKSKASESYQDYLIETLTDPEEAAGYLNAALEGGDLDVFLLAMRNVIEAQGGVAHIAERAHKGRTSLYKTLSKGGNPHLKKHQGHIKSTWLALIGQANQFTGDHDNIFNCEIIYVKITSILM